MWDRAILKSNAKLAIKPNYLLCIGVSVVAAILTGSFVRSSNPIKVVYNLGDMMDYHYYGFEDFAYRFSDTFVDWLPSFLFAFIFPLMMLAMAYSIFVAPIFHVGESRFYVHNRFGDTRFSILFSGFQNFWLNLVGAKFLTNLIIFLWSLLFVVPGIIASLRYSMVDYILSDNPSLPGSRARELSNQLTMGEKGSIFVLHLSFLGWLLLCGITFGIGYIFFRPYQQASYAELYIFLRDRAIQNGMLNPAELGLNVQPRQSSY